MSGKKTSVYLTDEILAALQARDLTPVQAIRRGIDSVPLERELLKGMAAAIIEIRDSLRCAQCLHRDHPGACATQCEQCASSIATANEVFDLTPQWQHDMEEGAAAEVHGNTTWDGA